MEHTELVEKYVNGEIDDVAFNAEFEKLDDASKKAVTEAAKSAKPKILEEISALRKEKQRVVELKTEAEKPPEDFIKKFRSEQVDKAMKRFFADRGVDEAEQAVIKDNFTKLDDGSYDSDLIQENLKRIYAYSFPDKASAASKEAGEEGAAAFISKQAASAGKSGEMTVIKDDDPRIKNLIAEAHKQGIEMTPDEARRGLEASSRKWGGLKPLPSKN